MSFLLSCTSSPPGMAANLQRLLRAGTLPEGRAADTLLLYNRTASKADSLVTDKALSSRAVESPAAMAQQCSIICIMLADDAACASVLNQLTCAGGKCLPGKVIINHSTTTPDFAKQAAQQVQAAGGAYLAVPVWGR